MRYVRLLRAFITVAIQNVLAYQLDFWVALLYAMFNFATGVLGVVVVFNQVGEVHGWTLPSALALLGVYLTLSALRQLFIGPSLEALVGMDGEIWTGRFDFTLLRPVDVQFLASFRYWRPLTVIDLMLGLGVLGMAMVRLDQALTLGTALSFIIAMAAGLVILYAILLGFSALVFWSPGFLFTWLFNALLQLARYPVGFYPGWLRFVLTWIIPVGVMTTIPAQALAGELAPGLLAVSVTFALILFAAASVLFHTGLRRYASASS